MEKFNSSHLGTLLTKNNTSKLGERKVRKTVSNPVQEKIFEYKYSVKGYYYIVLKRKYKNVLLTNEIKIKILEELVSYLSLDDNMKYNIDWNDSNHPYLDITNIDNGNILRYEIRNNSNIISLFYDKYNKEYKRVHYFDYELYKHIRLSGNSGHNSTTISDDIKESDRKIREIEASNSLKVLKSDIGLNENDSLYVDRVENGQKIYDLTFNDLSEADVRLVYSYVRGLLI